MSIKKQCHKCGGTGQVRTRIRKIACDVCNGTGYVTVKNVLPFVRVTHIDSEADNVLKRAIGNLDTVIIIGYDKKGNEVYESNIADGASALWHLQRAIHCLMNIVDKDEQ